MTYRQVNALAVVVGLGSWFGLGYVVMNQAPVLWTQALLFLLLFLAVATAATPGLNWMRRRLGQVHEAGVVLRQAAWVGLFVCLVAAMQLRRMLDVAFALVLAAIFVLLELFLLQRPERMRRVWYESTAERRRSRTGGSNGKPANASSKERTRAGRKSAGSDGNRR